MSPTLIPNSIAIPRAACLCPHLLTSRHLIDVLDLANATTKKKIWGLKSACPSKLFPFFLIPTSFPPHHIVPTFLSPCIAWPLRHLLIVSSLPSNSYYFITILPPPLVQGSRRLTPKVWSLGWSGLGTGKEARRLDQVRPGHGIMLLSLGLCMAWTWPNLPNKKKSGDPTCLCATSWSVFYFTFNPRWQNKHV